MAQQLLNLGTVANDKTGDYPRDAGAKLNANFTDLSSQATRTLNKKIGSRTITGKTQLIPLTATTGLYPGQSAAADTTGVTVDIRVALPCAFDAIRVLIPNRAGVPVTGVKAAIAMASSSQGFQSAKPGTGGNLGAANGGIPDVIATSKNDWGPPATANKWRKFYFGDQAKSEIDLPPAQDAAQGICSYTATDWMPCQPAPRTDGGTLPIVAIRLQYPPAGTTPASGATPSSPGVTYSALGFGNWAIDGALDSARPFNGGHFWKMFAGNVQAIDTNGINFQGSANPFTQPTSVPIIVQFRTVADVFTVVYLNDSIGEYNTNGEYAASYAFRGALAAATAQGKALAWCPLTWPSGPLSNYGRLASLLMEQIKPTILWAKPIGPNEMVGTLSQATQDAAMYNLGYALELGRRVGARVIIEPALALRNAGAGVYGTSDSFRLAWNAAYAAQAAVRDYTFAAVDAPWAAGGTTTNGQQEPSTTISSDGVHSTEAGHVALTPAATTAAATALALV